MFFFVLLIVFVFFFGQFLSFCFYFKGYIISYCNTNENNWKRGVTCLFDGDVVGALNMQKVVQPQLYKIAVTSKCSDSTVKPYMSETEIVHFVYNNYGLKVNKKTPAKKFRALENEFFCRTQRKLENTLRISNF